MSILLYGSETCSACKLAMTLLGRTPIDWQYVDVRSINYQGEIPVLILEDGTMIVGLGQINNYVKSFGFL
jgi:glutaredoxin-related protein